MRQAIDKSMICLPDLPCKADIGEKYNTSFSVPLYLPLNTAR